MPNLRFRRLSLYVRLFGVRWEIREDGAISHNCETRITGGYSVVMVMSSNTTASRKNSLQEVCDELCLWDQETYWELLYRRSKLGWFLSFACMCLCLCIRVRSLFLIFCQSNNWSLGLVIQSKCHTLTHWHNSAYISKIYYINILTARF